VKRDCSIEELISHILRIRRNNEYDHVMTAKRPQPPTAPLAVRYFFYIVALALLVLPLIAWLENALPFYQAGGNLGFLLLQLPARLFALIGFVLMFFQFILGTRLPLWEKVVARAQNLKRHRTIGKIGFFLILLHGLMILIHDYISAGQLLFDTWRIVGIIALVLLIVAVIAAWFFRPLKLSRKAWRTIHLPAYVVFPLGFFHARALGTELATSPALDIQLLILFGIYCVILVYRIYVTLREKFASS